MTVTIANARRDEAGALVVTLAFDNVETGGHRSLLNIDFQRVGRLRDELVWGGGVDLPTESRTLDFTVPAEAVIEGLYAVTSVRQFECRPGPVIPGLAHSPPLLGEPHELLDRASELDGRLFVEVQADRIDFEPGHILPEARVIYRRRPSLIASPLSTPTAASLEHAEVFQTVIFCVGARLHNPQHMMGVSIVPYGNGMDSNSLVAAMNAFLGPALGRRLDRLDQMELQYAGETPLFAVVFHKLRAADAADAADYGRRVANDICAIIAAERGARPRPFGNYVCGPQGGSAGLFLSGYRGNLIAPLAPLEHAERIEQDLPKVEKSPRARLLMGALAQALGEPDPSLRCLHYWTVFEIATKGNVANSLPLVDAHGNPILDGKGAPMLTGGSATKIYKYLFDNGMGNAHFGYGGEDGRGIAIEGHSPVVPSDEAEIMPLWAFVGALSEIRNAVAHEGVFRPDPAAPTKSRRALAARPFAVHEGHMLLSFLESLAAWAVRRELANL